MVLATSRLGIAVAAFVVVVAAVVVASAAISHRSEDDAPLRALQADPLGRYSPPGARLLSTSAHGELSGGLMGKPAEARHDRHFAVAADAADGAFRGVVNAARAAGWTLEDASTGVVGSKRLQSGDAYMVIVLTTDARFMPKGVPPPGVSIAMNHRR